MEMTRQISKKMHFDPSDAVMRESNSKAKVVVILVNKMNATVIKTAHHIALLVENVPTVKDINIRYDRPLHCRAVQRSNKSAQIYAASRWKSPLLIMMSVARVSPSRRIGH